MIIVMISIKNKNSEAPRRECRPWISLNPNFSKNHKSSYGSDRNRVPHLGNEKTCLSQPEAQWNIHGSGWSPEAVRRASSRTALPCSVACRKKNMNIQVSTFAMPQVLSVLWNLKWRWKSFSQREIARHYRPLARYVSSGHRICPGPAQYSLVLVFKKRNHISLPK